MLLGGEHEILEPIQYKHRNGGGGGRGAEGAGRSILARSHDIQILVHPGKERKKGEGYDSVWEITKALAYKYAGNEVLSVYRAQRRQRTRVAVG